MGAESSMHQHSESEDNDGQGDIFDSDDESPRFGGGTGNKNRPKLESILQE